MSRQWMTLMAILLVYIPVAIDATVLHGRADQRGAGQQRQ